MCCNCIHGTSFRKLDTYSGVSLLCTCLVCLWDTLNKTVLYMYVNKRRWGKKKKKSSFEPDSNQRPMDYHHHYSPPLYQLSYRRIDVWTGTFCTFIVQLLTYIILLQILGSFFWRHIPCLFEECFQKSVLYDNIYQKRTTSLLLNTPFFIIIYWYCSTVKGECAIPICWLTEGDFICAVAKSMEKSNSTTCIANCLFHKEQWRRDNLSFLLYSSFFLIFKCDKLQKSNVQEWPGYQQLTIIRNRIISTLSLMG